MTVIILNFQADKLTQQILKKIKELEDEEEEEDEGKETEKMKDKMQILLRYSRNFVLYDYFCFVIFSVIFNLV